MSPNPSRECRCNCGYICNRQCGLKIMTCMKEHYQRDCDHDFTGPGVEYETDGGMSVQSVTCSKCGVDAASHDLMVGP